MSKTEKAILHVLQNRVPNRTPVWLMRQAGRYLPEYRDLRAKAENFLNLCLTPEWATEITLQPLRRFDLDAAILFADILLIPMALGQKLEFREGEGPLLQPIEDVFKLSFDHHKLLPVYETLQRVKTKLPKKAALIGFCGAPWTVACYMIDGNSRNNFMKTKQILVSNPEFFDRLIDILVDASETYLSRQIEAGAEMLQIFDSWAGLAEGSVFENYVIKPTKELVRRLKVKYPNIPIIGFPREASENNYLKYMQKAGVDAVSIDFNVSLDYAKTKLQPIKPLQGNLDPALLVKGGQEMFNGLTAILQKLGPKHILNLGHGLVPETPPEHVADLVNFTHSFKFQSA